MDYWLALILFIIVLYVLFKALECKYYFKKYGIPQPPEIPFLGIVGASFFLRHSTEAVKEIYNMNDKAKYVGCHMFLTPVIVICDTDLIKSVLVKDFDYFAHQNEVVDKENDPLFSQTLGMLNGEKWRQVRNLLSPAFTSSKIRIMYVLMSDCAENFSKQFLAKYINVDAIDMRDMFTRYVNDVIATCAFGIEIDSLQNPTNQFYTSGRRIMLHTSITMLKLMLLNLSPKLGRKLGLKLISKRETKFFLNVVENTIKTREEQGITRPDMLQMMIDARDKTNDKLSLDLVEITAQALMFFFGGFETTSNQMCLIAHELAENPDIQTRLQNEIDAVMKETNGKPDYEAVNNMPYLDAVFSESMRKHPLPVLNRTCSKTYELPPALPDSKPFIMKPGMQIFIPTYAIHHNENFYENPSKFDPERFLNSKKATHSDATTLGFGLGPRMCLGNRFAILITKVIFVHLLAKCSLIPCSRTCIPLEYAKNTFLISAKGGYWLKMQSR